MGRVVKNYRIKIFYIKEVKDQNTKQTTTKKIYIHPQNDFLFANVRQQSFSERFRDNAEQDESNVIFIVNKNDRINITQYIEYNGFTYEIDGIDRFNFRQQEIKLKAVPKSQPSFDSIEGMTW